jgi:hypothetical protein
VHLARLARLNVPVNVVKHSQLGVTALDLALYPLAPLVSRFFMQFVQDLLLYCRIIYHPLQQLSSYYSFLQSILHYTVLLRSLPQLPKLLSIQPSWVF